jgi:protein Hikeshi
MFGIIVSGRPVITQSQTVSPTQIAFTIPAQPAFHHIVVFFLPGASLPADQAAAVYIQLPPSSEFKLLGAVANDKQSAIFKVREGVTQIPNGIGAVDEDAMVDDGSANANAMITIGISVEPAAQIAQALAAQKAASTQAGLALVKSTPGQAATAAIAGNRAPTKVLAKRIIENAYEYLASFTAGSGGNEVVPLKKFQEWWKKFEKKVELDPSFLERTET